MAGRWRFRKVDVDRWLAERRPLASGGERQARILVVDDDEHFRSLFTDLLQGWGYEVQDASDGVAALTLLKETAFDLLFVDLKMPGMNGIEVIREAREVQPNARIIIVTAYGSKETAIEALQLGVTDYLEKPIVDIQTIASVVETALRS
jgi:CheY-like chemotaxis protein